MRRDRPLPEPSAHEIFDLIRGLPTEQQMETLLDFSSTVLSRMSSASILNVRESIRRHFPQDCTEASEFMNLLEGELALREIRSGDE